MSFRAEAAKRPQSRNRGHPGREVSLSGRLRFLASAAFGRSARNDSPVSSSDPMRIRHHLFSPRGRVAAVAALVSCLAGSTALPQAPVIIRGGWVFTATSDTVARNRGILVRGGVFQAVNRDI